MSANSLVAAELAPGSSLSLDAAIARSRKFLAETAGHAFVRFTLVTEEFRPTRRQSRRG